MSLNIVVCIKQVPNPDYFSKITLDPETGAISRKNIPTILNPVDENAIEEALRLRERFSGKVTAISMGPPQAKEVLDWALTLGVDESVLLCDRAFAAADSLATAYVLAAGIRKIGNVDIVLCGNESVDGATEQVGPQVAELLDIPHICNATDISLPNGRQAVVRRNIEYGHLTIEGCVPLLITVSREINQPRTATAEGILTLMDKVSRTWGVKDIEVDNDAIGLAGSPTRVGKSYEQKLERERMILTGSVDEMVAAAIKRLKAEALV
ncbi:electron transfer flavoprotein subunit beta/FixA family protein [Sediminispirochaeta smaragdinae]|uniref:Electron transfer flavoprotein alpha/beta-subunit n=1 Tax=Sediminispirochaeta smaragdinae (strain DSM 11293 / JCM 15392 / SEBR 4228) TaxID=573413 RepID=E1R0Y9_SEDSS|nr:electron transfer flavoprotein subunit beta/FixA family protein [Sediminispirochaeta smaragdinae]ADK80238.1 Electron transfer flavoprotein alpha/beta-subunit [Sediminispirochaeta smaragdinae DSM 11293]